jgi:hypothetical protein
VTRLSDRGGDYSTQGVSRPPQDCFAIYRCHRNDQIRAHLSDPCGFHHGFGSCGSLLHHSTVISDKVWSVAPFRVLGGKNAFLQFHSSRTFVLIPQTLGLLGQCTSGDQISISRTDGQAKRRNNLGIGQNFWAKLRGPRQGQARILVVGVLSLSLAKRVECRRLDF